MHFKYILAQIFISSLPYGLQYCDGVCRVDRDTSAVKLCSIVHLAINMLTVQLPNACYTIPWVNNENAMLYIQQNQACIYVKVYIALATSVWACIECFYKTVLCSSKCSLLQVKRQHFQGKITKLKQKNKHTQNANVSLKYLQKRLKASSIQRRREMSHGKAKYLKVENDKLICFTKCT